MKKISLFLVGITVLIAFSVVANAGFAMEESMQMTQQAQPQQQGYGDSAIGGTCYKFKIGYPRPPLPGVTIAYGGAGVANGHLDLASGSVKSGLDGRYIITGLTSPGIYGLFAYKTGYIPWGHIVHLTEENPDVKNVDFTLIGQG
jgi:hypothetical protein